MSHMQITRHFLQASAFTVTYPVNNAIDKQGNDTKRAVSWERAFIQLAKVLSFSHIHLSFFEN